MTDELAKRISKGDIAILQTSDLGLFWYDSCRIYRYKVWAGVRVGQKVSPCVWGECDFHVNWLHVSRIRPTHWRLNDDFDINQQHRRLTRNIRIGVYVVVQTYRSVSQWSYSTGSTSLWRWCCWQASPCWAVTSLCSWHVWWLQLCLHAEVTGCLSSLHSAGLPHIQDSMCQWKSKCYH